MICTVRTYLSIQMGCCIVDGLKIRRINTKFILSLSIFGKYLDRGNFPKKNLIEATKNIIWVAFFYGGREKT